MSVNETSLSPTQIRRLIVLLGALVAFGPLSIDMYLPAMPTIAHVLGSPINHVQLTISGFLMGFCLGMLFYGPVSDRYGRRSVLLVGLSLYVVASLACAMAQTAEQLIALRVIQAIGGGAGSVMGRTVVRDVFPLSRASHVLSMMQLITMLAPLLAPMLGGWVVYWTSWRVLFMTLAVFGAICLAWVFWGLAETHAPERRAQGSLLGAFRAYAHILCDRRSLAYVLCLAGSFGALFAYIAGTPFVYIQYFGVSAQHYGYLFGLNASCIVIFTLLNNRLGKRFSLDTLLQWQLGLAAVSGITLYVLGGVSLLSVVLPLMICVGVTGAVAPNSMARLMQCHPERAGAAMALAVSSQFAGGMFASSLVSALHNGTPHAMTTVVGGACVLAWLVFQLTRGLSKPA